VPPSEAASTRRPQRAPLALRVGFLGELSREWLGSWVDSVALRSAPRGAAAALDALVVDPHPAGVVRSEVERLAREARAAGVPVVGLSRSGEGDPVWSGLADLTLGEGGGDGAGGALLGPPPVDPRMLNPIGFRQSNVAGIAALVTSDMHRDPLARALRRLSEPASEEPVVVLAPRGGRLPELPAAVARGPFPAAFPALAERLHDHLGALDHPSFHRDAFERAAWLVRLCACGVPVAAEGVSPELGRLLGEELAEALERASWRDLLDLDLRERISVVQRRAALRDHSLDARWRAVASATGLSVPPRPLVSVVLATRRETWLSNALEQIGKQNYEPRELVVSLHGDEFSPGVEDRFRSAWRGPLEIVHVDSELTLGDALNAGVEAASGEFVTKMDDDDPYSVHHLWDLVLALEYSGADLVGKAAEFVYLEEIDLTIRRFMGDVETPNHRLAGGGMMARRQALVEVGGWPSRARGEDTALVRIFENAHRKVHRTHGFGYILNRHGRDHTWRPYVDYFLVQSHREFRGLRYDEAMID
jgi:hypothetical protein